MKNIFSWSITFSWEINTSDFSFNFIIKEVNKNIFNIFMYWETKIESSLEIIDFIKSRINWEILWFDISISTEDKIKLFKNEKINWDYKFQSYEWIGVNFDSITLEQINSNAISIREVENSKIFWNKIIRIDYIN